MPEPAAGLPAPAYQPSRTPSAVGGGNALPAFLGGVIAGQILSPGSASSQPAPAARDQAARTSAPAPAAARDEGGGGGWIWIVLLLALAAGAFWWFRRQRQAPAPAIETAAAAASGVRSKVGAMVMIDPSPFVLLGPALTVPPPVGGATAIDASSVLSGGPHPVERLYLPADGEFVEIVRDAAGGIRQARWFGRLTEVHPADAAEWSFWLDAQDGMIGWPTFQTQDGQTWQRVWGSGGGRAQPMAWGETRESLDHQASRELSAMLYTRLADDGATQLYLLIAASDTGAESWVELHVGIDLNPVSLRLGAA